MNKRETGILGEKKAKKYLIDNGLCFVECNYHCEYGEIDLIFQDREELVFVEVKTRNTNAFGNPEDSVTPAKLTHILNTAEFYLTEKEMNNKSWRIDILAIMKVSGEYQIEWFKNVAA